MRLPILTSFAFALCAAAYIVLGGQASKPAEGEVPALTAVQKMQAEADALKPLVQTPIARQFLAATATLPSIEDRTIYREKGTADWLSSREVEAMPEEKKQSLEARPITESTYYNTKYGTPLAYSRALELLGERGVDSLNGKKILDFGYGTVGHLRLMASCGAHTVGLDVDSFLTALYCEATDQGSVQADGRAAGSIKLLSGRLSDDGIKTAVGEGYDLITSKNTLKRGYIHPPAEANVDKRMLVDLGMDDEAFVRALFAMLKPGGRMIIYNLSPKPAPPGEKYIPWADGRCPFDKSLLEKVGFQVTQFDQNDDEAARAMARALEWDKNMDVENDLFAHFTVLVKPGG